MDKGPFEQAQHFLADKWTWQSTHVWFRFLSFLLVHVPLLVLLMRCADCGVTFVATMSSCFYQFKFSSTIMITNCTLGPPSSLARTNSRPRSNTLANHCPSWVSYNYHATLQPISFQYILSFLFFSFVGSQWCRWCQANWRDKWPDKPRDCYD